MHKFVRGDVMAYKIVYGEGPQKKQEPAILRYRFRMLTALFLLVFCLLVHTFWPGGADLLRDMVIPGEAGVTEKALETMMTGLRAGESIGDALTAFCKEVIHNEAISTR